MAIFPFTKGLPTSATLIRTKACFVFFLVAPLLLAPSNFFPGRESLSPDLKVFPTKRVLWDQPIPQHALTPPWFNCTILCTLRPWPTLSPRRENLSLASATTIDPMLPYCLSAALGAGITRKRIKVRVRTDVGFDIIFLAYFILAKFNIIWIPRKSTHRCASLTGLSWISYITCITCIISTTEVSHQLISRDIIDIARKPVPMNYLTNLSKHRKNCECCPGRYLIYYPSMSWFIFCNLSVIVNCVTISLNRSQSISLSVSL